MSIALRSVDFVIVPAVFQQRWTECLVASHSKQYKRYDSFQRTATLSNNVFGESVLEHSIADFTDTDGISWERYECAVTFTGDVKDKLESVVARWGDGCVYIAFMTMFEPINYYIVGKIAAAAVVLEGGNTKMTFVPKLMRWDNDSVVIKYEE